MNAPDGVDTLDARLADNPFPGLRAFRTSEADVFFGRQRQIDDLLALIDRVPLVAVSGSSGCGKSSLVLAGLLRALELRTRDGADDVLWRPVKLHPGDAPIDNLARPLAELLSPGQAGRAASLAGRLRLGAAALAEAVQAARLPASERVLVVVDQFEELFRYRRMTDADESTAFVKLLVHAAENPDSPVSVILTLRSDSLGDCADYRDLPEAVSRGLFLVPRLTREQRKQAIVGPVERRGFQIAPRLVQRVLNDTSDAFDDLPVMQHALSRSWQQWAQQARQSGSHRPLDIADYDAIGGAAKALQQHADQAYASLGDLAPVAERIFRALTERISGPGSEVRRPLNFEVLRAVVAADAAQVAAVVDRFRRADTAFLLPPADQSLASGPIDISHESLIRGWPRLKAWADLEAQSAQMYRRLVAAAELYGDDDDLWRGAALQFALEWRERDQPNEHWAALYRGGFPRAMVFLEQSRVAREAEQRALQRRLRRRYTLVGITVVGCLAAAIVMGRLYQRSEDALALLAKQKVEFENLSTSRRLELEASNRQAAGQRDAAVLLGAAALQIKPTASESARETMRALLLDAPLRYVARHLKPVSAIAFSPDGKRFASASRDGVVKLWDLQADAALPDARGAAGDDVDLAMGFDATGAIVASPDVAGRVLAGGRLGAIVNADVVDAGSNLVIAFDAESLLFASSSGGAEIRVWSLADGRLRSVLRTDGADVVRLAFAPGGRTLAAVVGNGATLLWAAPGNAAARRPLRLATSELAAIAFSADGRTLATAGRNVAAGIARGEGSTLLNLWDVGRGSLLRKLPAPGGKAELLTFSPDGRTLAAGGEDGKLTLWDLTEAAAIVQARTIDAHKAEVTSLVFAPDGKTLASGSEDRSIVLWNVESGQQTRSYLRAHEGRVEQLAFAPDSRVLASTGRDQTVLLWDVARAEVRHGSYTPRLDAVAAIAFDPTGAKLALASEDSFVWLWDVATGTLPADALGRAGGYGNQPEGELTSVAVSADGRFVAAGGEDHRVRLWSAASGESVGAALAGHTNRVAALAFSPDSRLLASGGRDKAVILWPLDKPAPQPLPAQHTAEVVAIAFNPKTGHLATASRDRTLVVWDLARRQPLWTASADHEFTSIAFSPDGVLLAGGSFDGRIRFWNARSGEVQGADLSHAGVSSLAFDTSGGLLASGGSDAALRLWSVKDRAAIGEPMLGHQEAVLGVAFRPDGRTVASTSSDRRVIFWDVDFAHWPQRACRIASRDIRDDDLPRALRKQASDYKVCAS